MTETIKQARYDANRIDALLPPEMALACEAAGAAKAGRDEIALIVLGLLAGAFIVSKPGGDPSSGISSVDVLILTERHPACRQREARSGSCMERENLAGDAKGKGASGSNREAESTDAPERGGLPRSSVEAG